MFVLSRKKHKQGIFIIITYKFLDFSPALFSQFLDTYRPDLVLFSPKMVDQYSALESLHVYVILKTFMLRRDCINNQLQHCNICNSSTLALLVVFATFAKTNCSAFAAYCTVHQQEMVVQLNNHYYRGLIYIVALKGCFAWMQWRTLCGTGKPSS
jgi:hypothetical protein